MPPFREGPIKVDRRFDGDALKELREIGHGHAINIVDASYDIPRGSKVIRFPGSSADALLGVVRLIPIEGEVVIMDRDEEMDATDPRAESVSAIASRLFEEALDIARNDGVELDCHWVLRDGFYEDANNAPYALFIRTIDTLPFACALLDTGHSQQTD